MLYEKNNFNIIFKPYSGSIVNIVFPYGNAGDWLIWEATFQLMKKFDIKIIKTFPADTLVARDENIKKSDIVFWSGGGNMGDLYKSFNQNPQKIRRLTKVLADKNSKTMIILPQTWTSKDSNFYKLFCREYFSNIYEPKAIFCHDLALGYEMDERVESFLKNTIYQTNGYFFRSDIEANYNTENYKLNIVDPIVNCKTFYDYFELASHYEIIHTNRLHFAICALILNKQVHLYNNSYFKNKAVFQASLQNFKNINFIDDKTFKV